MKKHFWGITFKGGLSYQVWAATIKTAIALAVWANNKEHPQNNPVNSAAIVSATSKAFEQ